MNAIRISIGLMVVLASSLCHGQLPRAALNPLAEPRFERIGAGIIPRDVVASLAQDKAGFIWVATGDGLMRYDGFHFRPLERESPEPAARNLGWIRAMLPARDGRLWIATETDGLAHYDPVSGRVSLHRDETSEGAGPAPNIVALAEDLDGAIWTASVSGLDRFDPANASFTHFSQTGRAGALPDKRISALLVDRDGNLWVGTWNGLGLLRRGSDQFETMSWNVEAPDGRSSPAIITALLQASDGRIWVGSQQGNVAIVDQGRASLVPLDPAGDQLAPRRGAISAFVEAPNQLIWVGGASGIDLYDLADLRLMRRLRHDLRNPTGLAANHVSSLLMDQAGDIWVGGFGLGLQRHDPNSRSIWVRGPDLGEPARLAQADFRSLLQLDNGEIWAATPDQGVVVMDAGLLVVDVIGAPPRNMQGKPKTPVAPLRVDSMAQAPDGTIWLGGPSMLMQYSRQRKLLGKIDRSADEVHHLLATDDGSLWIATSDGLFVLRPGATRLLRIANSGGVPLTGQIFVLAQTADKTLWIGGATGLSLIRPGSDQVNPVVANEGRGLASPVVIGLLVDRDGGLWIDTAIAGLHHMLSWDGEHASFDRISERHGVVRRPFGANLLQDERGRIWSHMYLYDPAADRLVELTPADGVNIGTGWFSSYAKTLDGRLLFGGSKGLLVVRAEPFDISDYSPRVVATELRIDGIRQRSEYLSGGLTLDANRRAFSIEFAALDFSDAARNQYAYQLQGLDSRWIATSSNFRAASYGNLDPGDYLLRVRATNRSGVWSPHELVIPVSVMPAWWQHWGFRLAVALMLAAGLYWFVQWRTRHLRSGKLELERMVGERTAELEQVALALQKESAALEEASLTDPLSGLRNRRFLGLHVEADTLLAMRRYESHARNATWLAEDSDLIFFLVDIDHFKQINDRFGHAAGDAVIMQIRSRLLKVFRDSDYLIRWGGEEFLILARGTARANAAQLADRVLAAIADEPFELDNGTQLAKTCSVGFTCFPLAPDHPRAFDWNDAVNTADAALLAVKASGRNGWLGLISARGESAEELGSWLRRPLVDWWRTGQLDIVFSPGHSGWVDAKPGIQ